MSAPAVVEVVTSHLEPNLEGVLLPTSPKSIVAGGSGPTRPAIAEEEMLRRRLHAIATERVNVVSDLLDGINWGLGNTRSRTMAMLSLYPRCGWI